MAWETIEARGQRPGEILAQASSKAFMASVYRWMTLGLGVTAAVALYTASNIALLQTVSRFIWPLLIVQLLLVVGLSAFATRLGGGAAAALFVAYAALTGLTFGTLFLVYQVGSIGSAFLLTAGVFGALSIYASVTKRDLSAWRTFLFMGLIGVVIAGIVNVFLRSTGFSFVLSCAAVVVFAGLTAYDTQKLRTFYAQSGGAGVATLSIVGALTLYLDFINLFLALLRLFGDRRR